MRCCTPDSSSINSRPLPITLDKGGTLRSALPSMLECWLAWFCAYLCSKLSGKLLKQLCLAFVVWAILPCLRGTLAEAEVSETPWLASWLLIHNLTWCQAPKSQVELTTELLNPERILLHPAHGRREALLRTNTLSLVFTVTAQKKSRKLMRIVSDKIKQIYSCI